MALDGTIRTATMILQRWLSNTNCSLQPQVFLSSYVFACKASFEAHSYCVCRAAVPYNGHYYQIAPTRASFADDNIQASQMSYDGYLGYLAAVSSQDKFNFVVKVLGARNVWLASTDINKKACG